MKYSFILLYCFCAIYLTGCNKAGSIKSLCNNNPKVCNTFKADTWCKIERKNLLIHYNRFNQTHTDADRYQVLIKLEDYQRCMSLASQIKHVKLKGKEEIRINNRNNATKAINKLVKESKQSTDPHILYYRWSRFSDSKAINQLLLLEGSTELETPELQLIFATYHTKRSPHKTLSYLFHALELYQQGDEINTEIFNSLSTIFTDKNEYKQVYIWLKVLILLEPKNENISNESLELFAKQYQLNLTLLNKVALATLSSIQEGTFKAPSF